MAISQFLGAKPVDAFTVFMILKCTWGSARHHPFLFRSTWKRSAWIVVVLERSDAPSVSGWYDVNILCFIPESAIRCFQNLLSNSLSRSLTISFGHPFHRTICQKISLLIFLWLCWCDTV